MAFVWPIEEVAKRRIFDYFMNLLDCLLTLLYNSFCLKRRECFCLTIGNHAHTYSHTQTHTDCRFERITFNKWYLPIILCAIYKRNLIFIRIDFDRSAFFMQFGCIDSVAFRFVHIQLCNCYFDWNISMKHTFFTCFLRWCSVWDLSCTWDKAFVFI